MEKENTAKSGTGGTQVEKDKSLFFEKFISCCAAMSGPGGMDEKMKDCCGGKEFNPDMMEKWTSCCGTGDKKE